MGERMANTKKELEEEIEHLEGDINATKADMAELLDYRNKEVAEFRQALKDDSDAIVALSEYYKRNKMPIPELIQKQDPDGAVYSHDPDKAPETTFSAKTSHNAETGGILAILEMLVEDCE